MKKIFKLLAISLSFAVFLSCIKSSHTELINNNQDIIFEINNASVALVNSDGNAFCGGTWVSAHYILTARHCVEDTFTLDAVGKHIGIKTFKEANKNYPLEKNEVLHMSTVYAVDSVSDSSLLYVKEDVQHKVAPLRKDKLELGEHLHIIGHPSGLEFTYLPGTVSQVRMYKRTYVFSVFNAIDMDQKVIQVNADVWFGNSGGGAFDEDGNLVGLASFIREDRGMSFFVHKELLINFLNKNKITYYLR